MDLMGERFSRSEGVLGADGMQRLSELRVIVFGVGGVGSWCAECLVRTGVRQLTIVDFDTVCHSNINRQLMATTSTVGEAKVTALRRRLLDINPEAEVTAICNTYCEATANSFALSDYDYVVDAIDSVPDKALLIRNALAAGTTLLSSMGAAKRTDPQRVSVAEFWKVQGCPLARALRHTFKRNGRPHGKFLCVYSDEQTPARNTPNNNGQQKGSLVQVTAVFGFTLASLIVTPR